MEEDVMLVVVVVVELTPEPGREEEEGACACANVLPPLLAVVWMLLRRDEGGSVVVASSRTGAMLVEPLVLLKATPFLTLYCWERGGWGEGEGGGKGGGWSKAKGGVAGTGGERKMGDKGQGRSTGCLGQERSARPFQGAWAVWHGEPPPQPRAPTIKAAALMRQAEFI